MELIVFGILFLLGTCSAQIVQDGECDDIPVATDFKINDFLGTWNVIETFAQNTPEATCARFDWSPSDSTETFDVTNTQVAALELTEVLRGTVNDASTAKMTLTIPGGTPTTIPYWILATDHANYALAYSCIPISDTQRRVSSWKLSRTWGLTTVHNDILNSVIATVPGLSQELYQEVKQSDADCFYLPEVDENKPVTFRGQCEEDITRVEDFDIERYVGWWHQIESYPTGQPGDCRNSRYTTTTTAGQFQVVDTVVNNNNAQRYTYTVTATPDGQLIRRTPEGSAEETWIVLATDYENYSLLYKCENDGTSHRRVWSAKHSKTGQITNDVQEVMAQIITSIPVLDPKYYLQDDQSNSGCFYLPEVDENEPVIFRGQCEDNVARMEDFNIELYAGWWHQIESYPTGEQGDCRNSRYITTTTAGQFQVVDTVVNNNNAQRYTYTVTATPDGQLIRRTPEGSAETWVVLATDYENYSLLYKCEDLDDFHRRVWSAKHSKTGEINDASQAAMAPIIAAIPELNPQYYLQDDQSNSGCFYLPAVDENEPVIFRGQCEDNLARMEDFNIERYAGWWHQFESYSTGEEGTCRSSRYIGTGSQLEVVDIVMNNNTAQRNTYTVTATSDGRLIRRTSQGVQETWIVLATDYENYSLLYKCENVDRFHRRVWSAKHSKSEQITDASQGAMAEIVAEIPELDPQYYQEEDQTINSCFYYPPPDGTPVILRGQCDKSIPVVTEFDTEGFSGVWYHTEKYPEQWDVGTCSGVRYTENTEEERIDVREWHVVDDELDELDEIEGYLTQMESTNNAARFISRLPSRRPGENPETTIIVSYLYVLRTDYTSYAITFSCVDVNPFEQRINVWKLSRGRTIPDAVITDIDNLLETRPELDQQYFEEIEQNDDCPASSFLVKSSIIVILVSGLLQLFL